MILTVSFKVKNFVEVMESWPIKIEDMTFFLDREDNAVKSVSISFAKVPVSIAPKIAQDAIDHNHQSIPTIKMSSGEYVNRAIQQVLNWQAVVSGLQIFDLDFDRYETSYHPETIEEEGEIHLSSFSLTDKSALNSECDFEQIGRAFCVEPIGDARIESTSHYRDGRIAFEAGRYVDAYNNLFLFLETRYCDGKTQNNKQVKLLSETSVFVQALTTSISAIKDNKTRESKYLLEIFSEETDIQSKIEKIVLLRGRLRHHSLKSPHRWDPNKQAEYEAPARFLSLIVGEVVMQESVGDIYSPATLSSFREISVSSGFETKIQIRTSRLEKKPALELKMSYPTTVISSKICLVTLRNAIEECARGGQLEDTVKLDAVLPKRKLGLFCLEFGIWAYTEHRRIKKKEAIGSIRCSFEHSRHNLIIRDEFSFPVNAEIMTISYAWDLVRFCFNHIENKDPTTRIMNAKLFLDKEETPILEYRVGAQVKN